MCPQNLSQRVKTLISDSSKYDELLLSAISPSDPADQIIVATAREENATVLTKDKNIHTYDHVRSLW
jgi:PIN domain nuclease of toxin-antitoxin system